MTPIVMGTDNPKRIGEVVVGCWGSRGEWLPNQRVVTVREATRDEWVAWNASCGVDSPRESGAPRVYFYEVVTD